MYKFACLMLAASGIGIVCLAESHSDRWTVREQETIDKTLHLSGQPMRLVVENFDGYVHVTGTDSTQVHVVAHETIRAETEADLKQAKAEVSLDTSEQPGSVSIEYKAPWICKNHCSDCCDHRRRFYEARYDIDIEAPRSARAVLSDVNGPITLDRIDGDFDVHGVNGAVRMSGIAGAGDAHTVNGPITVQFANNPSQPCSMKTVNGAIDAYFQPRLSADLFFKTFNGEVWGDFDVAPLPTPAGDTERKNGMFVYRSNRRAGGRVGQGGPEISFETLNGTIRLHVQQH
jgi:hypothetical protein